MRANALEVKAKKARLLEKSKREAEKADQEAADSQKRILANKKALTTAIAELKIEELNPGFRLTISLGVAGKSADDVSSLSDLLRQADVALYAAKKAGRNCVQV